MRTRFVLTTALLAAFVPSWTTAQTIQGRVLDQDNEQAVGGAIVSLVDADGGEHGRVLTDSVGRFRIVPSEAGEFYVVAERFGYFETRSPLIALSTEGLAALDLLLVPEPVGIEGLAVSVEVLAEEELGQMGLTPAELGNRWIGRQAIEDIPVKRDLGVILERTAQIGMQVIRPQNLRAGSDDMGLCFSLQRARTGAGTGRCALIVLDGIPITGVGALDIDPDAVGSMAVLEPTEATTFYGTAGGAGAVLVWTRRGR